MKNLTDFRKTVETGVNPRQLWNLYLFGHPRATWAFSKLQGLQYDFPKSLGAIYR